MRLLRSQEVKVAVAEGRANLIRTDWVLPPNSTIRTARVGAADTAIEPESPQPFVRVTVADDADAGSTDSLSWWVFDSQLESQTADGGPVLGQWIGCTGQVLAGGGRTLLELGTGSLNRVAFRFRNCDTSSRKLTVRAELWG
jgi:hypothetical protein